METEPAVSRSRRKVTRVNYAEDNSSLDDLSLASAPASSSKQPKSSAKKTALNNSGSIDSNNGNGNKSEPNSNSSFPMNWQRRIAANEKLSTVIDYTDAKLEADGKIHLQDGMTLGLEGNYRAIFKLDNILFFFSKFENIGPRSLFYFKREC